MLAQDPAYLLCQVLFLLRRQRCDWDAVDSGSIACMCCMHALHKSTYSRADDVGKNVALQPWRVHVHKGANMLGELSWHSYVRAEEDVACLCCNHEERGRRQNIEL
jgi:hypothetical protein